MEMITLILGFLVYGVGSMWILINFLWPLVQKWVKMQGFFGNVLRYGLLFILNSLLNIVMVYALGSIIALPNIIALAGGG